MWDGGNAAKHTIGRKIARDSRFGSHHGIGADLQVPGNANLTGQSYMLAKSRAAGNTHLRNDHAVFTDNAVVGDLHQVVDLGPALYHGHLEGCAIDGRIRAY